MGDNHGDTESLEVIVDETADEAFDFIVDTGDITDTHSRGVATAAEQPHEMNRYSNP